MLARPRFGGPAFVEISRCGLQNNACRLQDNACGLQSSACNSVGGPVGSRTAPVDYPAQQHCEAIVLASFFGGRRVKPLKPNETMHETAWQACETDETGVKLIKKQGTQFFIENTPVSPVSHTCHAVSCTVSSGFNGFTCLPPKIDASTMASQCCCAG